METVVQRRYFFQRLHFAHIKRFLVKKAMCCIHGDIFIHVNGPAERDPEQALPFIALDVVNAGTYVLCRRGVGAEIGWAAVQRAEPCALVALDV